MYFLHLRQVVLIFVQSKGYLEDQYAVVTNFPRKQVLFIFQNLSNSVFGKVSCLLVVTPCSLLMTVLMKGGKLYVKNFTSVPYHLNRSFLTTNCGKLNFKKLKFMHATASKTD